jgi:hypothetical protein
LSEVQVLSEEIPPTRRLCKIYIDVRSSVVYCCKGMLNFISVRVRVRVTLQLTVSQSVCLDVEPNLGLLTRDIIFFLKVTVLSYLGRPL